MSENKIFIRLHDKISIQYRYFLVLQSPKKHVVGHLRRRDATTDASKIWTGNCSVLRLTGYVLVYAMLVKVIVQELKYTLKYNSSSRFGFYDALNISGH